MTRANGVALPLFLTAMFVFAQGSQICGWVCSSPGGCKETIGSGLEVTAAQGAMSVSVDKTGKPGWEYKCAEGTPPASPLSSQTNNTTGLTAAFVQPVVPATDAEKHELAEAIQEARTSAMDTIRALESHLKKYPNTSLRDDMLPLITKSAMEVRDDPRLIRYGVPLITKEGSNIDANLLDRTAAALIRTGGEENARLALDYGKRLEAYIINYPVPRGVDAAKNQEDHDRLLARTLLYQARALITLGQFDEGRRKAALAFIAYPEAMSARVASEAYEKMGRAEDAIARLADAFAVPDLRVTEAERAADRRKLGQLYKAAHNGSEKGLGDEILAAYDRTSVAVEKELNQLRALDPNMGLSDPMQYTLAGLGETPKLSLPSLKGKVVIFDFWATWCVPCRAQHPLYEEVKKRFRDRDDVIFLSVDTDEDSSLVPRFLQEQKWVGPVYFESGLAKLLTISSIPATIIANKQGRLVSRMDGYREDTFVEQLTARIRTALENN